jgi:alcohol dehydrogenase
VHEDHAAKAPSSIDLVTAAAVPLAGLTALQALRDEVRVMPESRVFITGGAGGVGTFAIQIAKHLDAHVTTTASARGEALVRTLGTDVVIDYGSQRLDELPRDHDGAFDTVGGASLTGCFAVVKPGGPVVSIAGLPEPLTAIKDLKRGAFLASLFWLASFGTRKTGRRHGVRYRYLFMHESGADLKVLASMIDAGALRPIVDRVLPFDETGAALAYLEEGRAKGKVVVKLT